VEIAARPAPATPGADGAREATVLLEVGGMHCQSCAGLIEETLARDFRVHRATVDLDAGRASVVYDPQGVSVADLCAAVTAAGYAALPVAPGVPAS
jgi:copper chaperone CopZ